MKPITLRQKKCLDKVRLLLGSGLLLYVSVAALVFSTVIHTLTPSVALGSSGRSIDLFCLKSPKGTGPNQPGGKFGVNEHIVLLAYVAYNDYPVQCICVGFEVHGQPNKFFNITIVRTAATNESGFAEIDLKVSLPSTDWNAAVFGIWTAAATASIAEQSVVDTLTFEIVDPVRTFLPLHSERFIETDIFTK